MNYYERHIGDYLKDTAHLSLLEHGVYTRLMDVYYTREGAIPAGEAARLIGARSKDEREAPATVLSEFFVLVDGLHRQDRCEREIERFQDKQRKAKASADARWSQSGRNANASPDAMRTHSEGNAPRARPQTPDTRPNTENPERGTPPPLPRAASPEPNPPDAEPTAAGLACRAIKAAGILDVNPGHPTLLRLLQAGQTAQDLAATAAELVGKGRGKFALLLATVEGRLRDAAQAAPLPATGAAAPPPADAWRKDSRAGIAMGQQLQVPSYPDDLMPVFERRVLAAWRRAGCPELAAPLTQERVA